MDKVEKQFEKGVVNDKNKFSYVQSRWKNKKFVADLGHFCKSCLYWNKLWTITNRPKHQECSEEDTFLWIETKFRYYPSFMHYILKLRLVFKKMVSKISSEIHLSAICYIWNNETNRISKVNAHQQI